jgi:hypothetical protein
MIDPGRSDELLRELVRCARSVVDGQEPPGDRTGALTTAACEGVVLTVFHRDGRFLLRLEREPSAEAVGEVVSELAGEAGRALSGTEPGDLYLHLQLVDSTTRFPNFGIAGFFDAKAYEPRINGLAYELGSRRASVDPLQAVLLDLDSKRSRQHLARQLDLDPREMPARSDLAIEISTVTHGGERFPDHDFVRFVRGNLPVAPCDVSKARVLESLQLIGEWYENNVCDGEVTYQFDPRDGRFLDAKRTIVRSTMAAWILNRLAEFLDNDRLRGLGEETIEFYLERYFRMSESLAAGKLLPSPEPLANGYRVENHSTSAAFVVASILERGELGRYSREVELLMEWCMGFQRPDGTLWTQWAQNQFFMPGQLLLIVARLYRATGERHYLDFLRRTFEAYERPYQGLMKLAPANCTPFAPAWATQPAVEMYLATGDEGILPLIREINDRIVGWCDDNARYAAHPDYDGILAPKPGYYGNVSITAAALESLVDAARVAEATDDQQRLLVYRDVIRRAAAFLLRLQYAPANTYFIERREQVVGAFKKDLVNNLVWCDSVWHTASAFMKIFSLAPPIEVDVDG